MSPETLQSVIRILFHMQGNRNLDSATRMSARVALRQTIEVYRQEHPKKGRSISPQ